MKIVFCLLQSLRHLCRRVEGREDIESFRLKMILRYIHVYIHVCIYYMYVCIHGMRIISTIIICSNICSNDVCVQCILSFYFRLLQIASFSGKMNALNEVYTFTVYTYMYIIYYNYIYTCIYMYTYTYYSI